MIRVEPEPVHVSIHHQAARQEVLCKGLMADASLCQLVEVDARVHQELDRASVPFLLAKV